MSLETVEQIVEILSSHPVSEITFEQEGLRIVAKKALAVPQLAPPVVEGIAETLDPAGDVDVAAGAGDAAEENVPQSELLTAALVGLFRHSEPPLGYGAIVSPGQIVGSIEAMKVLNDVRAETVGQVVDVFVEEGAPVEYGQALFRLLPQ